jgi:HlyD family secretion protein
VIDVDNSDLKLRPGMTANVTVVYAERTGVLTVPNAALRFRPPATNVTVAPSASVSHGDAHHARGSGAASGDATDSRSVWLLKDGELHPLSVKTGLSDGNLTEIVEGDLSEGSAVVVDTVGPEQASPSTTGAGGGSLRRLF